MGSPLVVALLLVLFGCALGASPTPKHVHLSIPDGSRMDYYAITWKTEVSTKSASIKFTNGSSTSLVNAISRHLVTPKCDYWTHTAVVGPLTPGSKYRYSVGNDNVWSSVFSFVTPLDKAPYRFLMFGDLGFEDAMTWPLISKRMTANQYTMAIQFGDLAYNLHTSHCKVGDDFMDMIEPVAAMYPYQACVGNHEKDTDLSFSNWKYRFNYNIDSDNMFYSWSTGPVHFIVFSSELYYFDNLNDRIETQYNWLVKELQYVNANRQKWPWIVAISHRGFYCLNSKDSEGTGACNDNYIPMRDGIDLGDGQLQFGMEKLFMEYGVDLFFNGHVHTYERFLPLYQGRLLSNSSTPYVNPKGTVQIISGTAGNNHLIDNMEKPSSGWPRWVGAVDSTYGIGQLDVFNATFARWQQHNSNGQLVDEIWIVTQRHGPFQVPNGNRL